MRIGVLVVLVAALGCGDGRPAADDAGVNDSGGTAYPPITVLAMIHGDPLPELASGLTLTLYEKCRAGMAWYTDLATETGLRLSMQSTGVWAEAVVSQGDAADYADFGPDATHHLAQHIHSCTRGTATLDWTCGPGTQDPAQTLRMFNDQVPFVNQLLEAVGHTAADNWYLHGAQASYVGMDGPLLQNDGTAATTYPNVFRAAGGPRGLPMAFRGPAITQGGGPASADGDFVLVGEVGGIIGRDELHGPEGMVYGSVPYQRRDFLRVLLEWRENARLDPGAPPLHYTFMVHPVELTEDGLGVGTDGRLVRESIRDLVLWLGAEHVGRIDGAGRTVARYGVVPEVHQAYLDWEAAHPEAAGDHAAAINEGAFFRRLPGIDAALQTTAHAEALALGVDGVVAHRFVVTGTSTSYVLLYSDAGATEVAAGGYLPEDRDVMAGDGTVTGATGGPIAVGEAPILIGPRGSF